jgi:hypothetical protein
MRPISTRSIPLPIIMTIRGSGNIADAANFNRLPEPQVLLKAGQSPFDS